MLIGLKPCFCNSIETHTSTSCGRNYGVSEDNLHFDEQIENMF